MDVSCYFPVVPWFGLPVPVVRFDSFSFLLGQSIVMRDRETGRSRGFGFVTYGSVQEADNAIASMNDVDFEGRRIKVQPLLSYL